MSPVAHRVYKASKATKATKASKALKALKALKAAQVSSALCHATHNKHSTAQHKPLTLAANTTRPVRPVRCFRRPGPDRNGPNLRLRRLLRADGVDDLDDRSRPAVLPSDLLGCHRRDLQPALSGGRVYIFRHGEHRVRDGELLVREPDRLCHCAGGAVGGDFGHWRGGGE